jgi:DNA-binding beta-propeller fold protein YncE
MSTSSEATGWGSLAPTARCSNHGGTGAIRLPVTWPLTAGAIYVAENHEDGKWIRVRVLSPAGKELATWPSIGRGDASFNGNTRITVDSVGRVFLVDGWHCRVVVFDASGAFLGRWGSCGFGDGQFDGADGIAVDAAGKVYVADYNNNRVQVFQVREVQGRHPPVDFFGIISRFAKPRR